MAVKETNTSFKASDCYNYHIRKRRRLRWSLIICSIAELLKLNRLQVHWTIAMTPL